MTRTLQELNFEANLNSTTILKHATDKLPYSEEFKWIQFVLRQRIQQPTLADFNQWIREIAEAHEFSKHQGRSGTSLSAASDTHQQTHLKRNPKISSTTNSTKDGTTAATTTNTEHKQL